MCTWRARAEAEGLTLRVADNKAGYFGVTHKKRVRTKPYEAQVNRGGKTVSLGTFATAEEAALCIARSPEARAAAQKAAAAAPPLTSGEARQQAEAEGLTLLKADNKTGYFCVHRTNPGKPRRYQARVWRAGKQVHLGHFVTAEEAALCVARSPEGRAAAVPPARPLTSEEARQQAQAEGLTLRVAKSKNAYFGVYLDKSCKPKPYQARVRRGGKDVSLGRFATAEEAALHVARSEAPPPVASEDSAGWAARQEPQLPSDDGGDDASFATDEGQDEFEVVLDAVEVPAEVCDEWTYGDNGIVTP